MRDWRVERELYEGDVIYRDPIANIPKESHKGASQALDQALNKRNRESKRRRFGFSTSEDAVTWVVFTHLLRSGKLLRALRQVGLLAEEAAETRPTLLLWGVPIDDNSTRGEEIRKNVCDLCRNLGEDPNSFSEPDVIVDLGDAGLVFIEVKHLSGNDQKFPDYPGWKSYLTGEEEIWRPEEVKSSGFYELARNWRILKGLAGQRPAALVNLGPAKLFADAPGVALNKFVASLHTNDSSLFKGVTWPAFLEPSLVDAPDWYSRFCRVPSRTWLELGVSQSPVT